MKWPVLASILSVAASAVAVAQTPIERQLTGPPDTNINAGVFTAINQDCSTGSLPEVRLVAPPAHGNVTVTQASVHATKKCAGSDFPALVAIYRSTKDFTGRDNFSLEVKETTGETQIQIAVTVK